MLRTNHHEQGLLRPARGRRLPPRRRQDRREGGDARPDGVRDAAVADHGATAVQEELFGDLQQDGVGRVEGEEEQEG